jgi:hypothetical protein
LGRYVPELDYHIGLNCSIANLDASPHESLYYPDPMSEKCKLLRLDLLTERAPSSLQ